MKKLGVCFMAALFLAASASSAVAKGKKKGKAARTGPAPAASSAAIAEIKGDFKWGMSVQQVIDKINERITATYKDKLERAANDPARNDRFRKELRAETGKTASNMVKFDGQKTGWDVSIIDQEIVQGNGQTMVFAKEKNATRYFFFSGDTLYKMFIAFDKDMLAGKSFEEFGQGMQAKFGKAQPVHLKRALHGIEEKKLDHYLWGSTTGDGLRLVDRSEFYDVYCLVVYDVDVERRMMEIRKAANENQFKGSVVDSVISDKKTDRDENDNVIDRITGKEVLKPGDRRGGGNIVVPSTSAPSGPGLR